MERDISCYYDLNHKEFVLKYNGNCYKTSKSINDFSYTWGFRAIYFDKIILYTTRINGESVLIDGNLKLVPCREIYAIEEKNLLSFIKDSNKTELLNFISKLKLQEKLIQNYLINKSATSQVIAFSPVRSSKNVGHTLMESYIPYKEFNSMFEAQAVINTGVFFDKQTFVEQTKVNNPVFLNIKTTEDYISHICKHNCNLIFLDVRNFNFPTSFPETIKDTIEFTLALAQPEFNRCIYNVEETIHAIIETLNKEYIPKTIVVNILTYITTYETFDQQFKEQINNQYVQHIEQNILRQYSNVVVLNLNEQPIAHIISRCKSSQFYITTGGAIQHFIGYFSENTPGLCISLVEEKSHVGYRFHKYFNLHTTHSNTNTVALLPLNSLQYRFADKKHGDQRPFIVNVPHLKQDFLLFLRNKLRGT